MKTTPPYLYASLFALGLSASTGCDAPVDSLERDTEESFRSDCGRAICGIKLNTDAFIGTEEFFEFLPAPAGNSQSATHTNTEGHTIEFIGAVVPDGQQGIFIPADGSLSSTNDGDLVIDLGGQYINGAALIGVTFDFLVDGQPRTLEITDHRFVEGAERAFLFEEHVGNGQTVPICDADPNAIDGGEHFAFIFDEMHLITHADGQNIPGQTFAVENLIHIACASGAPGKAANYGFRPYNYGDGAFDAMIRIIRADYCGNGVAHTIAGSPLGIVYEGMEYSEPGAELVYEAVFDGSGAVCLSQPRVPELFSGCPGGSLPVCDAQALSAADQNSGELVTYISYTNG